MIKLFYSVNLMTGDISATTDTMPKVACAIYNNLPQADFCSLGILLQNMNENQFKLEREINQDSRKTFDSIDRWTREGAQKTRKELKEKYAEYWI